MCCAEFLVKYILFFANLVFALAGIALIGIGIAVLVQLSDILELIPVNVNAIPIAVIVLGSIIFLISFFGCCGAIREGRCMLIMYGICMAILAGLKIWLAVVIFQNLADLNTTVTGWLTSAFAQDNLRAPFHVLEATFRCCGTTGPSSYNGVLPALPPSCCATTVNNVCLAQDAYQGCNARLGNYFESFGDAIAGVLIAIIIVELVAMIFGFFLSHSIQEKRRRRY